MRGAMICVSVMLAVIQVWPVFFGNTVPVRQAAIVASHGPPATAASSFNPLSGVSMKPAAALIVDGDPLGAKGRTSCYRHYQIAFAACAPGDRECRVQAADQWDLCEATGFWGN